MKWLTVLVLSLAVSASTVFAQSAEQKDRLKVFSGWIRIVRRVESTYKAAHGRYGDLSDLQKAHLLEPLVFESELAEGTHVASGPNFVPTTTSVGVTISNDGRHFSVEVREDCVSMEAGDGSTGFGFCDPRVLPLEDDPDGPIIAIPG